jgi:DNA-binding response OmpR family regulator
MALVKKILIAEDELPLSKALQLKLSKQGYNVVPAYDGQEAFDKLSKEKFDLLLLDLVMPKKDGFELLKDLQANKIKVPVIVTSNLGQEEDVNKTKQYGVKGYLVKAIRL